MNQRVGRAILSGRDTFHNVSAPISQHLIGGLNSSDEHLSTRAVTQDRLPLVWLL